VYATEHYFSLVIGEALGFHIALSTALGGLLPRIGGILHAQGQELYSIAMLVHVVGNGVISP
jgi:hypothetical protein